jgi:uncharacterized membrane protein YfcA
VAGAAVLVVASSRNLTVFLALMTLAAVAISASGVHAGPPTPRRSGGRGPATLLAAGALSGFMGVTSGIGGPPLALLYQRATGPEIRTAFSRFFLASSLWSAAVLRAFGRFDLSTLGRGLALAPGIAAGYLVSGPLLARVDRRRVRLAVLGLSTASALLALAHGLRPA